MKSWLHTYNHSTYSHINIKEKELFIHDIKIIISTMTGHAVSFSSIVRMELTELLTHIKGA